MKKKRMTAIMLLAVLFILSACNGKVENPEEMVDHDVLVWRMAFPAAEGQADSLLVLWENGLNQILKEKGADYTVSIEPFSTDDAENRKAVRVADELKKLKDEKEQTDLITLRSATQYPDLAGCHLVYPACAEEGLLLPLDSLLASEKGSSLKEAIPEKDLERAKLNGTTYGLSALHPTIDATAYSIEQMEELGITKEELQGSIFEKEDLLRRVKEETGKIPYYANAYGIRYKLGLWVVSPSENLVMNQEGRFVNVTETKEFKEYLTRFVEWKEKGLIGCIQEWSADSVEDIPFANSIASYRIAPYEAEVEIGLSGGITEKVLMYVVPDETCPNVDPYWADDKTCIASWSKNQEKAEDFLILLMTDPDVANLMQYGREGKEYTMSGTTLEELPVTKDGEEYTMDENAFAEHKIAVVFLRHFGYQYTNQLITHSTIHMEEDKLAYAENFAESYESMVPNGFRFDPEPVLEQIVETNKVLDVYQGGETAKKLWNLEIEDVNQFISDLTEEMKQAGMDEIVKEANRQLDEWKKKNS